MDRLFIHCAYVACACGQMHFVQCPEKPAGAYSYTCEGREHVIDAAAVQWQTSEPTYRDEIRLRRWPAARRWV
jgi:hypothetical protein